MRIGSRPGTRTSAMRISGACAAAVAASVLTACATPEAPSGPPQLRDITGADERPSRAEPVQGTSSDVPPHRHRPTDDVARPPHRHPPTDDAARSLQEHPPTDDDLPPGGEVTGSKVTGSKVTGSKVTGSKVTGSKVTGDLGESHLDVTGPTVDHDQLDAVVNGLLRLRGSVLHELLRRGTGARLTEDDAHRLRAALGGRRLLETTRSFQRYAHDDAQRAGLLPLTDLGHPRWTSEQVVHAERDCVVVIGSYDLAAVAARPYDADERTVITLGRLSEQQLAHLGELNPTGWRIEEVVRLITLDSGEPIQPSRWEDLDYVGSMALDSCHDFEAFT